MVPVLIADFETTVVHNTKDMRMDDIKNNCKAKVWQAAFTNLDKEDHLVLADSIDEFMYKVFTYGGQGGAHVLFHNLANFDGAFIWDWALKHGYEYVNENDYSQSDKRIVGDLGRFTIFKKDKIFNFYDTLDMIKSSIDGMSVAIAKDTGNDEVKGTTPLYTEEEVNQRSQEQIEYDDWYIGVDVKTLKYVVNKYMIAELLDHDIYTQSNLAQKALDLDYNGFEEWYKSTYGKEFDGRDLDLRDLIPYRRADEIKAFTNNKQVKLINKVRNKDKYYKHVGWTENNQPKYEYIDKQEYIELKKQQPKPVKHYRNFSDLNWLVRPKMNRNKTPIDLSDCEDDLSRIVKLKQFVHDYENGDTSITEEQVERANNRINQILDKKTSIINNSYAKFAFKGGYNFVNPIYQNRVLDKVLTLDINSMYPWILATKPLPKGNGHLYKAKTLEEVKDLSIVRFNKLKATIREDWSPFIKYRTGDSNVSGKLSHDLIFKDSKIGYVSYSEYYMNDIDLEDIYLTSEEVRLMERAYDIHEYEIKNTRVYERDHVLESKMKRHIEFWMKVKRNANSALVKNYAKMMLNAVYGKLGNFDTEYKQYDYIIENGLLNKVLRDDVHQPIRDKANVASAAFITAYGRCYLADMINQIGLDRFVYCDTDSLHILGWDIPDNAPIDSKELGYYKIENYEKDALYIKCKTYGALMSETEDGEFEFKCAAAGIHDKPKQEEFKSNGKIYDKKNIRVNGGTLLVDRQQLIGDVNKIYLYLQALYRNDIASKVLVESIDDMYDEFIQSSSQPEEIKKELANNRGNEGYHILLDHKYRTQ